MKKKKTRTTTSSVTSVRDVAETSKEEYVCLYVVGGKKDHLMYRSQVYNTDMQWNI